MLLLSQKQSVHMFWVLFTMTIATLVGMQITGNPLITEAAPGGIVTFELIGSFEGSQAIMDSWQGITMRYASINMGLDFLFLTLYGITIALGCLLISARMPEEWKTLKQIGWGLAVGVLLASALDIVENIALIKLLLGSQNEVLPVLARWVAIPKFILVLVALLYVIGGVIPVLKNRK